MLKIFFTFFAIFISSMMLNGNAITTAEGEKETKMTVQPEYLYKILSLGHWNASQNRSILILSGDDDAFIHLSTEDQVDKIIEKYWSNAPQYVILKIKTNMLEGKLVLEANPGGTNKYYHLYQGRIPLNSIVEAKVIYNDPVEKPKAELLGIVTYGTPVLRHPTRELSVEEILSPEIQSLIEELKLTMRAAPGVGLAAPQIGKPLQLAVIEDMDHDHLTPQQLKERNRNKVPFHVVINPRLYLTGNSVEFLEGCLSVPNCVGIVPRSDSVRVECLNEKAEPVVIHAEGWHARILQHEIDHLNGILYIDRSLLATLMTEENYVKLFKGQSVDEIKAHLISTL